MYIYIYIHTHTHIYIYIYIHPQIDRRCAVRSSSAAAAARWHVLEAASRPGL